MLVGAVMGFWAVQHLGVPAASSLARAFAVAAARGRGDGADPRVPRDHATREPDRVGARAHDLRRAAGLSSYLGNDLQLADAPARDHFAESTSSASATSRPGADPLRPVGARLRLLALRRRGRPLPGTHAAGPERTRGGESPGAADAMGINVTAYRYAHTLVGGALAGVGGACFSLRSPAVDGRVTGGAGLDRHRARHLRVLAGRPLPGRRLPLRRVLGAAVDAAGARVPRGHPLGGLPGAALRHDHRGARARVVGSRSGARRARCARHCRTCGRSGEGHGRLHAALARRGAPR